MTDTNELRKLLNAATPTPWAVSYGDISWQVVGTKPNGTPDPWTFCTAFDDGSAYGEYAPRCTGPTRDLIVAAVNALPAMLDELDAARAEAERLKDDAARWHNLLPVYEDAEQEVKQLRADLREAMELLRAHGEAPTRLRWKDIEEWNTRYGKLLEKHKETPMALVDFGVGVNWKGLHEDMQRLRAERDAARADLREAISLLRNTDWEKDNWDERYDALLAKHKEAADG